MFIPLIVAILMGLIAPTTNNANCNGGMVYVNTDEPNSGDEPGDPENPGDPGDPENPGDPGDDGTGIGGPGTGTGTGGGTTPIPPPKP